MIYFVTKLGNMDPVKRLLTGLRKDLKTARTITYEELFHTQRAPIGHYVFTDQDRLSNYECEVAIGIAVALREADPNIQILNYPGRVLERYPLLRLLEKTGMNQFSITRLDDGTLPERYPVFIRCEDYHKGADTGLIHSPEALDEAIAELARQGKVLKRRVAVEFCAEKTAAGYYRKYGVLNIHGSIIPQHIIDSDHWLVKSANRHRSQAGAEEQLEFVRTNPHREYLGKVFRMAQIDYGRIDYGIVDDRIQIYEINTNPNLPWLDRETLGKETSPKIIAARSERRSLLRQAALRALHNLDVPLQSQSPIRFPLPNWKYHKLASCSPRHVRWVRLRANCSRTLKYWEQRYPKLAEMVPLRSIFRSFRSP